MFNSVALLGALAGTTLAGTVLWDGRFNNYTSSSDLDKWSWSNQVGAYQNYIHGTENTTDYINFSSDFKNPADTVSKQGAKMTLDSTSHWEGQTMLRTELIPQTTAAINKGKVYYHFSMQHTGTNAPLDTAEHQVCFFESHFTEMRYGDSGTNLQWYVGGVANWSTPFTANEWHNIAYGVDFDAQTVEFYHSTGSDALTLTAGPASASASSNGADWHLGVLSLGTLAADQKEDWYFSGVYVESGDLTTTFSGSSSLSAASTLAASSTVAASSSAAPSSTAAAVSSAAKPITTSASAAPTTMQTVVSSSSSVAVSSSSVATPSAASMEIPITTASASFTEVAPVTTSASSSSVSALPSAASAYTSLSRTPAPIATSVAPMGSDGACAIEYVYV